MLIVVVVADVVVDVSTVVVTHTTTISSRML